MSAIDAVGIETRQVLLEAMLAVAWADRELAPEEQQAARAAAISLGLVMPGDREMLGHDRRPTAPEDLDVSRLNARERELVYVCAAWMAIADDTLDENEIEVLSRLRIRLDLREERAEKLASAARELRAKQVADKATWWRSFDRLVVAAARSLE